MKLSASLNIDYKVTCLVFSYWNYCVQFLRVRMLIYGGPNMLAFL